MKKLTSVLLSLVMLMSVLCMPALATEQTDCLTAAVTSTSQTISVALAAGEKTTNGKFTVEFDSEYLTFVEADVNGIITNTENGTSSVTVSYATTTAEAIQVGETVATLTFTVNGVEESTELSIVVKEFNEQERLNTVLPTVTAEVLAPMLGDLDNNGKIQSRDVIDVLKAIASKLTGSFSDRLFLIADVDRNGKVTTRDAIIILQEVTAQPHN